jgi:hypothetical protein
MSTKRPGSSPWWCTWAHDEGHVLQASTKPEKPVRKDGRSGYVFGPFDSKEAADERLTYQHSRCLKTLAASAGM